MTRESPLVPRNLNTEETMVDSVTEQVPITPASEDHRSEVDDTPASSETLTSFNTNVSMGENGEPTLKHVLENKEDVKVGVIVNDVASVNIDAKLISRRETQQQQQETAPTTAIAILENCRQQSTH
mgnify:CR=1 FL=1